MKKTLSTALLILSIAFLVSCEEEEDPEVLKGLVAYYTFDDGTCVNKAGRTYNGQLSNGSYIADTPNGEGQALALEEGGSVSLGGNPISSAKNWSVSVWMKDFKEGVIFNTLYDESHGGPTLAWMKNGKLLYRYGWNNNYIEFAADLPRLSKDHWVMLTITTGDAYENTPGMHTLYINGQQTGQIKNTENCQPNRGTATLGGLLHSIGNGSLYPYTKEGYPVQPFKADNLRIYDTALTAGQVAQIYSYERQKHLSEKQ